MTVAEPSARVMHVITGLDTGGAETQLALLVGARKAAGAEDIVVSLIPGGALRERLENAGVAVHDLGMQRGRPKSAATWTHHRRSRHSHLVRIREPHFHRRR